jgi:hypothetical protein
VVLLSALPATLSGAAAARYSTFINNYFHFIAVTSMAAPLVDLEYKKSKEASISIWRLKTSPGHDGQPEGEVIQELDNEVSMHLDNW